MTVQGKKDVRYLDRQIDIARTAAVDTWRQARNTPVVHSRLRHALIEMAQGHERHAAILVEKRNEAQTEAHNPEEWRRSQRRTSPGLLGRERPGRSVPPARVAPAPAARPPASAQFPDWRVRSIEAQARKDIAASKALRARVARDLARTA